MVQSHVDYILFSFSRSGVHKQQRCVTPPNMRYVEKLGGIWGRGKAQSCFCFKTTKKQSIKKIINLFNVINYRIGSSTLFKVISTLSNILESKY